ncbi:D-glycero-beta-D-manno-heptose 1-phosphate adenylyltransferase [Candidatus Micrarchaeota archaeon]|nr:D-glycero-beta-D-manno-heptose 1-phosphate adenylyltransferase [Candidatus Micrarchaeota archaeon]MBU1165988.1 D-glycero-beta-D-manno-heptose 1-phosphate adenylyltransferase [Candidatus Micrarchaeota archaeon]MBU1886435.1 D-glycero-beta-D-manno-heptose 1-phosphate adenylyltransferase [Candidatus Micrarchaeota archaeon]
MAKKITGLQSKGKKIVFTNGVFDLMHAGHVRLLKKAASHGDVLVVGINSDASVKSIKGSDRPIVSQNDRAETLCALYFVDYVVIFDENTPEETILALKPDTHVKGGDWKAKNLPETKIVESYGGKVVIENSKCDLTTTKIIARIRGKVE